EIFMAWLRMSSLFVNSGCALMCLSVACGGSTVVQETAPPPGDDTSDDGGTKPPPPPAKDDGGTKIATAGNCTTKRPADPGGTATTPSAFFATHPKPQLVNQGGA